MALSSTPLRVKSDYCSRNVQFLEKRAVLNSAVLENIQRKDGFAPIPKEQWDQNQRDVLVCAECCDTELCNVKGCGELGLPPISGPICYGCHQERYADQCNKVILCDRDYECNQLGILNIGAFDVAGRRSGYDMTSKVERSALCNKCCTRNLCNGDKCPSLTHLSPTKGGCLYKGQAYNEGHKWQDGCDYICTCVKVLTPA